MRTWHFGFHFRLRNISIQAYDVAFQITVENLVQNEQVSNQHYYPENTSYLTKRLVCLGSNS